MKLITSALQYASARKPLFIVCGAVALLSGCASEPESHVVSSPPPAAPTATVMVAQPQPQMPQGVTATPTSTPGVYVISQAPPAPQPEAIPARPSSDHVWVPGSWTWRNNRYEWMAGHWEVPARANATWVAPRWEKEGGAYRFYEGYWN